MRTTQSKGFLKACIFSAAAAMSLPVAADAAKIYIDPGHGGSDPGAVNSSFGTEEADRVLYTGLQLDDWLDQDTADSSGGGSWTIRMSRTSDITRSLSYRTSDANSWGADRFLSLHQNAFNSSANGTETYSYYNTGTGADLRNKVQQENLQAWGLTDRGTKTAGFYVLRYTSMPAALSEAGFIDAPADHPYCSSDTECDLLAKHFMFAIQRHYGYAEHTPVSDVIVDNTDSGFTPGSGWWVSTSTPGYYGSNYRVRATAATSDPASWAANLPSSGTYKVYAQWSAGSNRASSAPYIVYHTGGSSTVYTDQTTNGGTWNLLGTYSMNSGTATRVILSCWTSSGSYVIGDAIKLEKQ